MQLPNNPSESLKRRNPDLYPPVGAVVSNQREPGAQPALERNPKTQPRRKGRLAVCITIIAFRRRLLDSDNSAMGATKALRDAIAASLGCDDGSERLHWQYSQVHTTGDEGCLVKIEQL